MDGLAGYIKRIKLRTFFPYLAFILIFCFFAITISNRFVTGKNFSIILQQAAVLAIVAFGQHFVIIEGGIDLSVGSVLALSGMVASDFAGKYGAVCGLLAGICVGLIMGLANGCMQNFMKIPSFIVTLGTQKIARGLATVYSNSDPIPMLRELKLIGKYPAILIVTLIVFVIAFVLYNYTKFGRYTVAIGGNQRVSELNGIPIRITQIGVFAFCGVLTGLGGVIMAARLGSAVPTTGVGFEVQTIASVAMGGASLSGGSGSIFNTLIGAVITAMLCNGLTIMGISSEMQEVLTGLILILAVFISLDRKKVGVIK